MNLFGIPIRVSHDVPPDEVWLTERVGAELRQRIADDGALVVSIVEQHKVLGVVHLSTAERGR